MTAETGSSGTVSQSAGSNTISVAGGLYLGVYATDQGFYNLSGGALTSNGFEFIGYGFGSTGKQ